MNFTTNKEEIDIFIEKLQDTIDKANTIFDLTAMINENKNNGISTEVLEKERQEFLEDYIGEIQRKAVGGVDMATVQGQIVASRMAVVYGMIDDNPKLTNRHLPGRSPVKIIFDPNDRADKNSDIFKSKNFIHITNKKLNVKKNNNKNLFLKKAIKFLYNKQISSILVEGGSFTIQE